MAVGVESKYSARTGIAARAVQVERALQVAHAHVVADDRQVLAPEAGRGRAQVAAGAGQRLGRVEALVHSPAASLQAPHPPASPRRAARRMARVSRVLCAHIDLHVQQPRARAGDDLGQPRGGLEVPARHRVGAPGALQEDQSLQHVGVQVAAPGLSLDQGPVAATRSAVFSAPSGLLA